MSIKVGKLTMIVGGMFSGKSTELQRQGKRHELAGRNVLYVKPAVDDRYEAESITTHDGNTVDSIVCETPFDVFTEYLSGCDVICIDEVQFFDAFIEPYIEIFLYNGVDVICSGLDIDRHGQPFGAVPTLLCQAEEVIKLKAVCLSCGEDAWISHGTFESDHQVEVGEKDKYKPLCRACYYEEVMK